MKSVKRLLVCSALVLSFLFAFPRNQRAGQPNSLAPGSAVGQAPPTSRDYGIVTTAIGGTGNIWHLNMRIDQPNVKQHITHYTGVGFEPGDRVTISAGGCVQTGGSGKTWKRYVDPQGPNSDRLYHGVIWIPGITGGLPIRNQPQPSKRLAEMNNKTFVLPTQVFLPPPADWRSEWSSYLRLGYEDDDLSDNGYSGHDDGTGDQCKGVGNAYVNITIDRKMPNGALMENGQLKIQYGQLVKDKVGRVSLQTGPYPSNFADFICLDPMRFVSEVFIEYIGITPTLVCRERGHTTGPACPSCVWAPTSLPR
jgi:hypothetical protein